MKITLETKVVSILVAICILAAFLGGYLFGSYKCISTFL